MAANPQKNDDNAEAKSGCLYVKVSMDGAPYLRKVDLKHFVSYLQLSSALEKMFSCFTIGEFLATCNSLYSPYFSFLIIIFWRSYGFRWQWNIKIFTLTQTGNSFRWLNLCKVKNT